MARLSPLHPKLVAVADIESESAAVAMVALHPGAQAKILTFDREYLPLQERTTEATFSGLIVLLAEAAAKCYAEFRAAGHSFARIGEVSAVVRAPWVRSKTARITSKLTGDKVVTEALIADLAHKAITQDPEYDRDHTFEANVARVELNGYPSGTPLGKAAHEISVVTLMSRCDPSVRHDIQTALSKVFPSHVPLLRSGVRAITSIMQAAPEQPHSYLAIDMGSACTSFAAIRDDLTVEYATLSEGTHTILKRIAGDGVPEEVLGILRMLEREDCTSDACNALRLSIAKIEPELVRAYGEIFGKMATNYRLPNSLVLSADQDFAPWLSTFFSRIDFTQFTTTMQPFGVTAFSPQALNKSVVWQGTREPDLGIASAAALVNIEHARA
jgi:hypothetical protein